MRVVAGVWSFARLGCFLVTLLLAGGGPATAQGKRVEAKAGQKTVIDVIGGYEVGNCTSLLPKRPAKADADNGRVAATWARHTFDKGVCKGNRIDVIVVTYQSNPGFRGQDEVSLAYWTPRARFAQSNTPTLRNVRYRVTVK